MIIKFLIFLNIFQNLKYIKFVPNSSEEYSLNIALDETTIKKKIQNC